MRSFEVLGYGGTLLSEYSKEQNFFFSKNAKIIYFHDIKKVNDIHKKLVLRKKYLLNLRKQNKKKIIIHDYFNRAKFILNNEKTSSTK